jgi:acyl-CoA thioesterase
MSFAAIMAAAIPADDGFTAVIPENWMQGRTAYGGLSAALAFEGARRAGPDLPPLRSAQVSFVGPLAGLVTVSARMLRRGRNAAWVAAEVRGEHGMGLAATFVFMGPIESELTLDDSPPPAGLIPLADASPVTLVGAPIFIGNLEIRSALPEPEIPAPEVAFWVRFIDRSMLDPMVEVMLIADAAPPAVMPLRRKGPVSSMTWLVNLLTGAPVTRDGWWLVRSVSSYARQGCSSQAMGLWNASGAPVASGMQSMALFG